MNKAEETALLKMRYISWIDQNEIGKNIAKNFSKKICEVHTLQRQAS